MQIFSAEGGEPAACLAPDLVERLVRHDYRLHTRELDQILWQALTESSGEHVELTEGVARRLAARPAEPDVEPAPRRPAARAAPAIDRSAIEQALARTHDNVTRAARELGLANRYALYRLMRKLGMSTAADQPGSGEYAAEGAPARARGSRR
jgi:two-component system nitrogen regulation response regulator GlnG/two-component system response regulator HydG